MKPLKLKRSHEFEEQCHGAYVEISTPECPDMVFTTKTYPRVSDAVKQAERIALALGVEIEWVD